jgi:hypothetical protein
MRAKLSALSSSSRAAATLSRTTLAGAILAGAILAGGCPHIFPRRAPAVAQTTQTTQGPQTPQSPETPQTPETPNIIGQPGYSQVYCSGFIRDSKLPNDSYLISGEEASYKVAFEHGDYVYINQGAEKGVKVGDRFTVVRPTVDPAKTEWFRGQQKILSAMGTLYRDLGQLRVVSVHPKVAIAEVSFSCNYMQRGDIVRPYEDRAAPPLKEVAAFDHFAPVSGKPVGTIVSSIDFMQSTGKGYTIYVNLGSAQGLKIGDYLRIFRHEGKIEQNVPVTKNYQYELYGFGSAPTRYEWNDLPREVLGEGIVLNASRNAATVLVTYSSTSIFTGDNVEIE